MDTKPDLLKVVEWSEYLDPQKEDREELSAMYQEAREFLEFYDWCVEVRESYVGILYLGVIGVFLFRIVPGRRDVDEWIWVIVGDLPSAYITCDECPNPATAIDGYIGAMTEWVSAAENGESVAGLIPVNIPATKENAAKLRIRLKFLDERILCEYQEDLKQ